MPKSLGQIHTVNHQATVTASGDTFNVDLAGELTKQLETMVRQGNSFKLVGLDMNLTAQGTIGGGQLSGWLRYYVPTRGRVLAYRNAFKAMTQAMKFQGVKMSSNKMYDFKVGFNGQGDLLANQATLNGSNGLVLHDVNDPTSDHSVFGVYNRSVEPTYTGSTSDLYTSGFNTLGVQNSPTDFVLNDAVAYTGNRLSAQTEWEYIPFQMSFTPDTTDISVQFDWKPDPALYVAVMTGQIQIYIDEVNKDGGATQIKLTTAFHVAGWKSIMADKKPRRRSMKSKSKSKSRRRRK